MSSTKEVMTQRILSWYELLPKETQLEFATAILTRLSSEQLLEIEKHTNILKKRDIILLLYKKSFTHIAYQILSYLDAQSLASVELVSYAWQEIVKQFGLWKQLIRTRVAKDRLWQSLINRLDLIKYLDSVSSGISIKSSKDQKLSNPDNANDLSPIRRTENSVQKCGTENLPDDYSYQQSDFYRALYYCLCGFAERIHRNWNERRCSVRRLNCLTEGRRGVYCVQYDVNRVVCGTRDGTIQLYSRDLLRRERVLRGHLGSVLCLQYDDSKLLIFSGSTDGTVRVWDIETGRNLYTIRHHNSGVHALRFQRDTLITGSKDHTVCVWQFVSPTEINLRGSLRGHNGCVNEVAFDDRYILSAGGDRVVLVWSYETHKVLRWLVGHRRGVTCMHYHQGIAMTGSSDLTVRIWNVETAECVQTLEGHVQMVRCIRFDETHIVTGSYDGSLRIWNHKDLLTTSKSKVWMCGGTLTEHSNRVFRVQIDPLCIVSCSLDNTIVVQDFFHEVDDLLTELGELENQAVPFKDNTSSISSLDYRFPTSERLVNANPMLGTQENLKDDFLPTECDADLSDEICD
ncbi:hypothetical protein EG68_08889 [Paragonimus skrjabini miyazakii]|uniref:F-box domain-containing protein n=1 Tax=Paragonimus skrjabini miyazakii TaxID=59628 RepID=A0A8S9YYB7_9TREM|nr:hypothetical protein EG68_08889 [Paragonimus skrjabini miyazakii]